MYREESGVNHTWRTSKAVDQQKSEKNKLQSNPGTITLLQHITSQKRGELTPESSIEHHMSGNSSPRRRGSGGPIGHNNSNGSTISVSIDGGSNPINNADPPGHSKENTYAAQMGDKSDLHFDDDKIQNQNGSDVKDSTTRRTVPGWPDRGRSPLLFPPPTVDGQPPRMTPRTRSANNNNNQSSSLNNTNQGTPSNNAARISSTPTSAGDTSMPPVSRNLRWGGEGAPPATTNNNLPPSGRQVQGIVAMSNDSSTASAGGGGGSGGGGRLRDLVGRHGSTPNPPDGVFLAQKKGRGESPLVVYRSPSERNANPERLNLDKRHLVSCPVLRYEDRVRLLNYQNNYIVNISNLEGLPNLIFLDLYNNSIEIMDEALGCVPTLRVLMLGKNRITKISNLELLTKLDVLDLHSNGITAIEGLSTLSELRVLNLAGNKIEAVTGVGTLSSLTELNVRRNKITTILPGTIDKLLNLQRIFMSNNQVATFSSVSPLLTMKHLLELTLDGNPIATVDNDVYRRTLLTSLSNLKDLDLKRISDSDRKVACSEIRRLEEKRRQDEQQEAEEMLRRRQDELRQEAILAAAGAWVSGAAGTTNTTKHPQTQAGSGGGLIGSEDGGSLATAAAAAAAAAQEGKSVSKSPRVSNGRLSPSKETDSSSMLLVGLAPLDDALIMDKAQDSSKSNLVDGSLPQSESPAAALQRPQLFPGDRRRPVVVPTVPLIQSPSSAANNNSSAPTSSSQAAKHQSREPSPVLDEKRVGFFEFEPPLDQSSDKGARTLLIYGEAWECLDLGRSLNSVTRLMVKYVGANTVLDNLIPRLDLFPRLQSLEFSENALESFTQLLSIISVRQFRCHVSLSELVILDNAICNLSLLRLFIAFNLSSLRKFNGEVISDGERSVANVMFTPLFKECSMDPKLSGELPSTPLGNRSSKRNWKSSSSSENNSQNQTPAMTPTTTAPGSPRSSRFRRNSDVMDEEEAGMNIQDLGTENVWKPHRAAIKLMSFEMNEYARTLVTQSFSRAVNADATASSFEQAWFRAVNMFISGVVDEVETGSSEALFEKIMQARRRLN